MTAIESSKSQGDLEWIAGAYEGYVSTLAIAVNEYDFYPFDVVVEAGGNLLDKQKEKFKSEVIDKMKEAINLYSKRKCLELQIEAMFKLCYFFIQNQMISEANEKLGEIYLLSSTLSAPNKVRPASSKLDDFSTDFSVH